MISLSQSIEVKCDQCKKSVSHCEVILNANQDKYAVIVYCHGEKEVTEMPLNLFTQGWRIVEALAFKKDKSAPIEVPSVPVIIAEEPVKTHKLDHGGPSMWGHLIKESI